MHIKDDINHSGDHRTGWNGSSHCLCRRSDITLLHEHLKWSHKRTSRHQSQQVRTEQALSSTIASGAQDLWILLWRIWCPASTGWYTRLCILETIGSATIAGEPGTRYRPYLGLRHSSSIQCLARFLVISGHGLNHWNAARELYCTTSWQPGLH